MNNLSPPSLTDHRSLEEVMHLLMKSPLVDGIAEFGSRTTSQAESTSDYDLLILVNDLPVRVFQMVTSIQARVTDVVLVEVETAQQLLAHPEPPPPKSFEALFAHKMQTARILYDATRRLQAVRDLVTSPAWIKRSTPVQDFSDAYRLWFWLSHGLLHMQRMAQSQDPRVLAAVDMMLITNLPTAWRGYFDLRHMTWEGEKAAIRFWDEHDREYSQAVSRCLELKSRDERLIAYRTLVELTLEPLGAPFERGATAVILAGDNSPEDVQAVVRHWHKLLGT